MEYAEKKEYKSLNISVVTLQGESQVIYKNEIFENRIVLIVSKTIKHNRVLNHVDFQMEETIKR